MTAEEKDEKLPVYDVEFIPLERRLKERRGANGNPPPIGERRQYGRRKEDLEAPETDPDPTEKSDAPRTGDADTPKSGD